MRKKILVSFLLILSLSIGNTVFSQDYSDDESSKGSVSVSEYELQPHYMNWYKIDRENLRVVFKPLTKDKIKQLSASDKAQYKKTTKIEKLLQKGNAVSYSKAYQMDNNYIPSILVYLNNATISGRNKYSKKDVDKLAQWAAKLDKADKGNIFSRDKINFYLGWAAWEHDDYQKALEYELPILNKLMEEDKYDSNTYKIARQVADSYFELKDYESAIKYAKIIPISSEYYAPAIDIICWAYEKLGNQKEAYRYAKLKYENNPDNYYSAWAVAYITTNDNEKLKYYKKAKQLAKDPKKIENVNEKIIEIYEKRIEIANKSITGFFEDPDIENIINLGMEADLNRALQYRGNDLKNAYLSLNRKVERILAKHTAESNSEKQQEENMNNTDTLPDN